MEVVFFRCTISMLLCFIALYRMQQPWHGRHNMLLILRGLFGTTALYTFFVTLDKMPLGTAVTIQYLSPIFTTIIAIFILNERVKPLQWLFFALSFTGVLIIKGFDSRFSISILAIGILSSIASGFAYNMVRKLKGKEHYMVIVLYFQIIGTFTGGACSVFNWYTPMHWDWLFLLAIGLTSQVAMVNLTKGLQAEKLANAAILNYLGIIYALAFGLLFFNEHYGLVSLIGIALVLSGVLFNFFYTRHHKPVGIEEELLPPE